MAKELTKEEQLAAGLKVETAPGVPSLVVTQFGAGLTVHLPRSPLGGQVVLIGVGAAPVTLDLAGKPVSSESWVRIVPPEGA